MEPLKITVCELDNDHSPLEEQWPYLMKYIQRTQGDLLLLPEMIFAPWFSDKRPFNKEKWNQAVRQTGIWIQKLNPSNPAFVLGSIPVEAFGTRTNQGFVWSFETGIQIVHTKYYLPDEEGFWEASWYRRGSCQFIPYQVGKIKIGFMICTDMWFYEHARAYGKQDVDLIVVPRATPHESLDKWLSGGRTAATVSGAYCISSNRYCPSGKGPNLGGLGWIIGPDGEVLAETSQKNPYVTLEIDLDKARMAKKTYPRYIKE